MRGVCTIILSTMALTVVGALSAGAADSRLGTLRGRVLAEDSGRPLPGVLVTAYSDRLGEAHSATSDRDGAFFMASLKPGRYFVDFTSPHGSRYASEAMFVQGGENRGEGTNVRIKAGKTRFLEHRLAVGAEIELRFQDDAGTEWDPGGGKEPHVTIVQSYADGAQRRLNPTSMDHDAATGRMVFRGLPRASGVAVLVHVPGYAGLHCPAEDLKPGQRVTVVARIDRENPTGIEGFVAPAAKVELLSEPGGHMLSDARADAKGHFAISDLPPALYGLRVNGLKEGLLEVVQDKKTHIDLRAKGDATCGPLPTLPSLGGDMGEVKLDLVARDGGGHALHDLRPDEIEVYENGVAQTIARLDHIDNASAHLSIVVDQVSAANWTAALKTATNLVDRVTPETSVAAFRIDGGITPIVPATTSKEAARAALAAAQPTLTAHEEVHDPLTADAVRALRSFGPQAREQRALYSLLAIVSAHAGVPGRKAIVFMCEGLSLSTEDEGVFQSVIAAANRVGVSLYPVDLRGMDAELQMAVAEASLEGQGAPEGQWVFFDEDEEGAPEAEEAASPPPAANQSVVDWAALAVPRTDERAALEELAAGTGGFVIANSDYLDRGIGWIAEDLRRYDEVRYVPADRRWDGSYRHIEVRVGRRGARVQYADGYLASPPSLEGPLLTYEIPLLRALGGRHEDFPVPISTYAFGQEGQQVRVAWSTEIPVTQMTFVPQPDGTLRGKLAFLTLVRDAQGRIVFRRSHDIPLARARAALDTMAAQRIQFVEDTRLEPGSYTIETVAHDVEGNRLALRQEPLEVSAANRKPGLGTLVVAAGFMTPTVPDVTDPFQTDAFRVLPAGGGTVTPSPGARTLPIYLVVDPLPNASAPRLTLELTRGGRRVTSDTLDLPEGSGQGSIRYVSGLPLEGLTAGDYEVHATVSQGSRVIERRTALHLRASQPAGSLRVAAAVPATVAPGPRTGRVLLDVAEEKVALGQVAAPSASSATRKSHKKAVAIVAGVLGLGAGAVAAAHASRSDNAVIVWSPDYGIAAGTEYQFEVQGQECGGCSWDFGDGTAAIGSNVAHVYPRAGTFTVRLTSKGRQVATKELAVDDLSGGWWSFTDEPSYDFVQDGAQLTVSHLLFGANCRWVGQITPPVRFSLSGRCVSGGSSHPSVFTGSMDQRDHLEVSVDGGFYPLVRHKFW